MNFDPSEGRWFVYESTKEGIMAMPVHDDSTPLMVPSTVLLDELETKKVN